MRIVLTAASLALFATPAPTQAARPAAQAPRWQVTCAAGTDEFASNCQARARWGQLALEFATGDSQVFLTVEAPTCRATNRAVERNWWRDELTGLSATRRKALLTAEVATAVATLGRRSGAGAAHPKRLGSFPDIAVHGDP